MKFRNRSRGKIGLESKRTQRKWTFILSAVVVVALTGCGMYPTKAGAWPHNVWGSVLHGISNLLDFLARHLGNSYGIAILIMTLLVRLIILPLFIRQLRYQRVMMEMQPQIQRIRSKYKGDNQKIQEETMKLYAEAGTNPIMGCLPMLIQLPVLWALYGSILGNTHVRQGTFLWFFPLGQPQTFSVAHFILTVIAALSTFLSSWLTMKNQPTQQRAILFIMPLFIIFIGLRMPGALVLYWIYTNLITALQTYWFLTRPRAAESAKIAQGQAAAKVPSKPASQSRASTSASNKTSSKKVSSTSAGSSGSSSTKKKASGSSSPGKTSAKKAKPKTKPSSDAQSGEGKGSEPDGQATE